MLNKTYLIGNVGHAPEVSSMQDGREIAVLSVATNSSWKDKQGNWQRHTEWHRVTVFQDFYVSWIKTSVKKGDSLLIEGKLSYSEWRDKFNHKRKVAHIVVYGREGRLHLLNTRKQEGSTKDSSAEESLKESSQSRTPESILADIGEENEELPSSPFDFHKTEEINDTSIEEESDMDCLDEPCFKKIFCEGDDLKDFQDSFVNIQRPLRKPFFFKRKNPQSTNGDPHEDQ